MSPKLVDKTEKAKYIAAVALALFMKRGFAATSVGQIANAAGVGKGTLYAYYDSKADIFVAAILEWMHQLEKRFRQQLNTIEDPVKRLERFVELNLELVDPIDPGTARLSIDILQHTLLQDGALHHRRYLMKEIHTGMRQILVDLILDGISQGFFRPELARDAHKVAINLLGYLDGISLHYIMSENYFDIREQVDFAMRSIIRLLADPATGKDDARILLAQKEG